jgi:hypothetical protein
MHSKLFPNFILSYSVEGECTTSLKCQVFLVSFSTLEKCYKQLNFHRLL